MPCRVPVPMHLGTLNRSRFPWILGRSSNRFLATAVLLCFLSAALVAVIQRIGRDYNHEDTGKTIISRSALPFTRCSLSRLLENKSVVILTHDLGQAGAPRLCSELASLLAQRGAHVRMVTLWIPAVPASQVADLLQQRKEALGIDPDVDLLRKEDLSNSQAAEADLIIASTISQVTIDWIKSFRAEYSDYGRLLWWVHESEVIAQELGTLEDVLQVLRLTMVDGLGFESWSSQWYWDLMIHKNSIPLPPSPIRVVHWGVNRAKQAQILAAAGDVRVRDFTRHMLGVAKHDFMAVTLASYVQRKGIHETVEAFLAARKQCGDRVKLHMVFAGMNMQTFNRSSASLELLHDPDIHFLADTSSPERLLASADVYVSNSQNENWGLSMIEAMLAGLPVLSSGTGGSAEQVLPLEHGLLHSNASELANNFCTLALNASLAKTLGANGRQRVQTDFGPQVLERELCDLLSSLMDRNRNRSVELLMLRKREAALGSMWTPRPTADEQLSVVEPSSAVIPGSAPGHVSSVWVIGGYHTLNEMYSFVRVWRPSTQRWESVRPIWEGLGESHVGMTSYGPWLFMAGGQIGSACGTDASAAVWLFDTVTNTTHRFRDLPVKLYMPRPFIVTHKQDPLHVARGEVVLHIAGGTANDRLTPVTTHWKITLRRAGYLSKFLTAEEQGDWTIMPPLPFGVDHAASISLGHRLYIIGGGRGHLGRSCTPGEVVRDREFGLVITGEYAATSSTFAFNLDAEQWERLPDVPQPVSHAESSLLAHPDGHIMLIGGAGRQDRCTGAILEYFPDLNRWHTNSLRLHQPRKGAIAWIHAGELYITSGQIPNPEDPLQHTWQVTKETYVTSLSTSVAK